MPANQLFCPSCKSVLATPKPVPAGSAVRCSNCRQVFTVPGGATAAQAVKAPPPLRPAAPTVAPAPPKAPPRQPAGNGASSPPAVSKISTFLKVLLAAAACAILLVGIVLGVLGKLGYDRFTREKESARVNDQPSPVQKPPAKETPERAVENVSPALQSPAPEATNEGPLPAPEPSPNPSAGVRADLARLKVPVPRLAKYEPEAKRWVFSQNNPINNTFGTFYIDLLPGEAPVTLAAYAEKVRQPDFQEPGRPFTDITDKGELPDGFFIQGIVKDQASAQPQLGFVIVRKVNGAYLRCRNGNVKTRPMKDEELRQLMLDTMKQVTIHTTPLISLPAPSGAVMLRDNVTLVVSQAEKGQLVYFDTMADRESKRVEVEFQPGELAIQGDTLFAAAKGSAQVHALEAATGKVKKEYNLGGDAIVRLACHPESGRVYASTVQFRVVSFDPADGAVTKTQAKGQFLAVSPDGKFLYTGVQPPDRGEIEFLYRDDGSVRIFRDRWGPRAMLMKYAVEGPDLKYISGQNNAAVNGWWMHLTPDGKRLMMVGGGGWRPPKEGGTGGGYKTAVFSTDNLETMLQPIPFSGLNTIFHPVLNLGVANSYGMTLTFFNGKSFVQRDALNLNTEREGRPLLLTFGGKGRKLILWNGNNIQKEQGLHFLPLPLKAGEEQALTASYGR